MKLDFTRPFHNWSLQLLALFIGVSLWYGLTAEDQVDMVLSVPLELRNLSPNMVVANQHRRDLEVSVHGPRRLLLELQQQNISLPVNLAEAEAGPFVVRNTTDSFNFPRSVRVQRVQPANVTLMLDHLVARRIPLVAKTSGIPAFGYSLAGVTLNPDSIEVNGPKTLLDSVQNIGTEPIDVEGLTRSATTQTPLVLSEPLQKLIGETLVEANVLIREPMVRRTVQRIPVTLKPAASGLRPDPAVVSVTAEIPLPLVQERRDLTALFQAVAAPNESDADGAAPVRIEPVKTPGHSDIAVLSFKPDRVRLSKIPEENNEVGEHGEVTP